MLWNLAPSSGGNWKNSLKPLLCSYTQASGCPGLSLVHTGWQKSIACLKDSLCSVNQLMGWILPFLHQHYIPSHSHPAGEPARSLWSWCGWETWPGRFGQLGLYEQAFAPPNTSFPAMHTHIEAAILNNGVYSDRHEDAHHHLDNTPPPYLQ